MARSGARPQRVRALFEDEGFQADLARYAGGRGEGIAARARAAFESHGVPRSELWQCQALGRDGTKLGGRVKVYLPLSALAGGERPFRMLFSPALESGELVVAFLAFGIGHQRPGSRSPSVYEVAHRRVHGQWPR